MKEKHELQAQLDTLRQRIIDLEQQVAQWRSTATRYRKVAEIAFDYIYVVRIDADGSLAYETDQAGLQKLTGFTEEELNSLNQQALVHTADTQLLLKRNELLMAGESATSEYRIVTRTNEHIRVRDTAYPVWDEAQGRVVRIYGGVQRIDDA
jgi:PAS domain-containing protein